MKIKVDEQADALRIIFGDSAVSESEEVEPGVVLDFDAAARLVAIEVLGVSGRCPGANLRDVTVEVTGAPTHD